jgi:hypothetical protein
MKVALYARYSSENQRDASIADQFRICRAHAEKQGRHIVEEYSDQAISGASLLRAGIQSLIADALRGRFSIVLAEAMDRLSRDQEDIAGLFKRFAFANVRMVTLSEGDVTPLHVGLKGTMNASSSRISPTRSGAACGEELRMEIPAAAIPTAGSLGRCEGATADGETERRHGWGEWHLEAPPGALPPIGPHPLRHVWWWLFDDLGNARRVLDRTQQGHLQQSQGDKASRT